MRVTPLKRPLLRRIGSLVVYITREGIELRGFKRRRRIRLTWEQIAALEPDRDTIQFICEERAGRRALDQLGCFKESAPPP